MTENRRQYTRNHKQLMRSAFRLELILPGFFEWTGVPLRLMKRLPFFPGGRIVIS